MPSGEGGYSAADRFVVVGLVDGVCPEDDDYFSRFRHTQDRFRPVIASEVSEVSTDTSGATDVYVYADRDFNGRPTGQRHRMLLRRVKRVPSWEGARDE
jgi:hypothetical protein